MRNLLYLTLAIVAAFGGVAIFRPDLHPWRAFQSASAPGDASATPAAKPAELTATLPSHGVEPAGAAIRPEVKPPAESEAMEPSPRHPVVLAPAVSPTVLKATDESGDPPTEIAPADLPAVEEPSRPVAKGADPAELAHAVAVSSQRRTLSSTSPTELNATGTPIGAGLNPTAGSPAVAAAAPLTAPSATSSSSTGDVATLEAPGQHADTPDPPALAPPLAGPTASATAPGAVSAANELLAGVRGKVVVQGTKEPDPAPSPAAGSSAAARAATEESGPVVKLADKRPPVHALSAPAASDTGDSVVRAAPRPGYVDRQAENHSAPPVANTPLPGEEQSPVAAGASSPNVVRRSREGRAESSPAQQAVPGDKDAWRRRWQAFMNNLGAGSAAARRAPNRQPLLNDGQLPGDTQLPTAQIELGQQDTVREGSNPLLKPYDQVDADEPGDTEVPFVTRESLEANDEVVPNSPELDAPTFDAPPTEPPAANQPAPSPASGQQTAADGQNQLLAKRTGDATPDLLEDAGEQDIVLHAGGSVRLRPPLDWHVSEVAAGRQMRLLITPEPAGPRTIAPRDGFWLVCHVRPPGVMPPEHELQAMIPFRIRTAIPQGLAEGPREYFTLDGWPAVQQHFTIHPASADDTEPNSRPTNTPLAGEHVGFHLLVRTTWGLIEAHAEVPAESGEARLRQLQTMVDEMKLVAPRPRQEKAVEHVRDAQAILGSWKSYKGRFRFLPDGRVVMSFDHKGVFALDEHGKADVARRVNEQSGVYTAQGNILRIVWDDGSKLNLRWRQYNSQLLITDHTGQTSRLARLLD